MKAASMIVVILSSVLSHAVMASEYTLTDLGNIIPRDINERGEVVGVGSNSLMNSIPAYWSAGGGIVGATPSGFTSGIFYGINDHGVAAGFGQLNCPQCENVAFTWTPSQGTRLLPRLPNADLAYGFGINDGGEVVGSAVTPHTSVPSSVSHPVMWDANGDLIDLFDAVGGIGEAWDINLRGQVVGLYYNDPPLNRTQHAFLWSAESGRIDLGDFGVPNRKTSSAAAINDLGHVVGEASTAIQHNAFLWTPEGGMRDLGTLPGANRSEAQDINNQGVIVGSIFYIEAQPGRACKKSCVS